MLVLGVTVEQYYYHYYYYCDDDDECVVNWEKLPRDPSESSEEV